MGRQKDAALAVKIRDALRVGEGFTLADVNARSTPGFSGDKEEAQRVTASFDDELNDLQERLYAQGRDGEGPSVLLLVQGMDTSGKGGIVRHVIGSVDPQGVQLTSFKAPSEEERRHHFLWRIRKALPDPGMIGVFDRSQYEDVLVVRVHNLVPEAQWAKRYAAINAFEQEVARRGTRIIKVMLHVSRREQGKRLAERLTRPDKHWKYNPADLEERAHWDDYMDAYQAIFDECSPADAPWYVVPADRKWYARLAVQQLLLAELRDVDPRWPGPDGYDPMSELAKLKITMRGQGA